MPVYVFALTTYKAHSLSHCEGNKMIINKFKTLNVENIEAFSC